MIRKVFVLLLSLSLVSLLVIPMGAFAASPDSVAISLSNSIKNDKASNSTEISNLISLAENGDTAAAKQIRSFDCFNKTLVNNVQKNLILAPNTSKTINFADGSKIVYTNTTTTVDSSTLTSLGISSSSITPMTTYPTSAKSTTLTHNSYIGSVCIEYEGGVAYWCDYSRSCCHIITCSAKIGGLGINVVSASAHVVTNDITDSKFQVDGCYNVTELGIVLGSVSGSDVIFVDSGGFMGWVSDGLWN